ncbi:MAG: type II toxin-antitoxin system HicB family antitoxin [Desulfovibrionaceae bacterium]
MLFPVAVNIEPGKAYGVAIPDIPGCFSAGDTLEEALGNVQEAVELHMEDAKQAPRPSDVSAWAVHPDYAGWTWALVNIDLGFLDNQVIRANLTVPRSTLQEIDRAAKARGMSRSAFMVQAARREMSKV